MRLECAAATVTLTESIMMRNYWVPPRFVFFPLTTRIQISKIVFWGFLSQLCIKALLLLFLLYKYLCGLFLLVDCFPSYSGTRWNVACGAQRLSVNICFQKSWRVCSGSSQGWLEQLSLTLVTTLTASSLHERKLSINTVAARVTRHCSQQSVWLTLSNQATSRVPFHFRDG